MHNQRNTATAPGECVLDALCSKALDAGLLSSGWTPASGCVAQSVGHVAGCRAKAALQQPALMRAAAGPDFSASCKAPSAGLGPSRNWQYESYLMPNTIFAGRESNSRSISSIVSEGKDRSAH